MVDESPLVGATLLGLMPCSTVNLKVIMYVRFSFS